MKHVQFVVTLLVVAVVLALSQAEPPRIDVRCSADTCRLYVDAGEVVDVVAEGVPETARRPCAEDEIRFQDVVGYCIRVADVAAFGCPPAVVDSPVGTVHREVWHLVSQIPMLDDLGYPTVVGREIERVCPFVSRSL